MPYLLDANIFIQAKNQHYGLDFCPAFWEWLLELNEAGTVFSIQKVGSELTAGKDELAEWAGKRGNGFFLEPPDPGMGDALAEVSQWIAKRRYDPAAMNKFLSDAPDYYLISHALAERYVVVTHEVPAPQSLRKVKIPDVCKGVGVEYTSPYEMLRQEGARFHLGACAPESWVCVKIVVCPRPFVATFRNSRSCFRLRLGIGSPRATWRISCRIRSMP